MEIEEFKFNQYKSSILINNMNIDKVVASNKFPFGKQDFKYFIWLQRFSKFRPLYVFCPQMIIYKTNFH